MAFRNEVLDQRNPKLGLQPEEELKFIKFLMERATDAVFCVAPSAQFLYLNDAACCLVGYSREELLSMTMHDVDPDFSPDVWSRHWRNLKQRGSLYFESFHQGEEGWSFPVDITVTYLECYGREYGCIFVRDIIKCKQIEVTLKRNNEALKSRVQEHTTQLRDANEQLCHEIAERKRAEVEIRQDLEQEKQRGEQRARFISMIPHKFRNCLNIVSLSTSLLRRHSQKWTEEKKLQYLYRIQTAVDQLSQSLDAVLLIGKAEAGKLTFEPRELDLDKFCRDLVAQLQLSDGSQHTFTFVNFGDCLSACVDEKLLQPILTNLLSNAIKYSSVGSTVDFALSCWNGEVIFQIKDEGIGIPAVAQQQLFEPFYRGGNIGDISGTGLGLTVVKKLLDIHGGQIAVASEVGVGTMFTVTLPLSQPV